MADLYPRTRRIDLILFTEVAEGNGDPHFIVSSRDQHDTKLCYDVTGYDGDVLLIVGNEDRGKGTHELYTYMKGSMEKRGCMQVQ